MGLVLDTTLIPEWHLKDHQFYLKLNPSNVLLHFGTHLSILFFSFVLLYVCMYLCVCVLCLCVCL